MKGEHSPGRRRAAIEPAAIRRHWQTLIVVLGALALSQLGCSAWDYTDTNSPANLAMQVQLELLGDTMYQYHTQTGRWRTQVDDLAPTSLPLRSPVWRHTANAIVFLWPQDLNSEPKDSAYWLLAYWNGGLSNRFGRVWVYWGDLRTERMKESELRRRLTGPEP